MKAVIRTQYGPPEVLQLREIDKPIPKADQVLVKVHAASVNPADWHIMRADPFFIRFMGFGILRPKGQILGIDVAGRVEAVGSEVTQFQIGDEVLGGGARVFAEYAAFRSGSLIKKPVTMSFAQAAAIPVAAITALQGLRDHGKLQSGHNVLINGASGGVGTFAVQIAKAMGATVTGVCSGRNVELVKSLGADHVIDYMQTDYTQAGANFDLILDNNAGRSLFRPLRALGPKGIYVFIGGSAFLLAMVQQLAQKLILPLTGGKRVAGMLAKINPDDLRHLTELYASGKVTPVIDREYPLSQVPEAIRYLEQGHARGKVVIRVES